MTTNDAVRPVAWVEREELARLATTGEEAIYYCEQDGDFIPLYPPSAIAHLQARVEALETFVCEMANHAQMYDIEMIKNMAVVSLTQPEADHA